MMTTTPEVKTMIDDPEEFTGVEPKTKADPKSNKGKSAAPVKAVETVAHPGTPKAVYHPPAEGEAHPQIARKSVAERLDAAEVALNLANLELTQATQNLRAAENAEADALDALTKALPPPSFDEVNRQRLAKIQADKMARVEAGETPVPAPVKSHGRSPIDVAAAQRPRTAAHAANTPLRSPVVRRSVV
jgi:hypothetical protein